MRFEINNINPMGCVRMTQRSKYIDAHAKRYLNYKSVIYSEVLSQLEWNYKPFNEAVMMNITFRMPIPSSWPKYAKKDAIGAYCTAKPDIDNMVKGLMDALNGLLFEDDNRVVGVSAVKFYSDDPGISFSITPVGGLSYGQAKKKEDGERKRI